MRRFLVAPILALAACAAPGVAAHAPSSPAAPVKPACTAPVVLVSEDAPTTCNLTPPQRLDIRMSPAGDWVTRCDDMGGEPIEIPWLRGFDGGLRCEGVDY
jgi:hypothetical protein